MAVLAGVDTAVRMHVRRGDDLDARDGSGLTPLMLAASKNKGAICALLVASGADISLKDPAGRDALAIAMAAEARDAYSVLEALAPRTEEVFPIDGEAVQESGGQIDSESGAEILEEEGDIFDLSEWEAEEDGPPPEADVTLIEAATAVHRIISGHSPIDDADDWADFEAFLPERAAPLPRAGGEEVRQEIRRLLLRALREGSVPERDVAAVGANDDGSWNEEGEALLRSVLGDMGAETDERIETGDLYGHLEESEEEHELVSEALTFLDDVGSGRTEPMRLYFRDMRSNTLLTADEEVSLGRRMEEGVALALDALAAWPKGVAAVLVAAERVRSGEINAEAVSEGGVDEPLEDGAGAMQAVSDVDEDDLPEDGILLSQADRDFLDRAAAVKTLSGAAGTGGSGERALREILAAARLCRPFLTELALAAQKNQSEAAARYSRAVSVYTEARERMIVSNLRLSISVVKRYQGLGLALDDLVQEGNVGLIKAVDRYDWRRGFRFSTYATWWIRQQASRAVADKGKTIRVPVHVHEASLRIAKEADEMARLEGRRPTLGVLSERLGISERKIADLMARMEEPASLYEPGASGVAVADTLIDESALDPSVSVERATLVAALEGVMAELEPRVAQILSLRFGLGGGDSRTLEETGEHFGVTRERIRQIEAKALKKLAHPVRAEILRGFLDGAAVAKHRKEAEAGSEEKDREVKDLQKRPMRRMNEQIPTTHQSNPVPTMVSAG